MFGFRLSKSSAIDLGKVDRTAFEQLCAIEPDAFRCMSCGSCTATCTAGMFSEMGVRKVLLNLQRGKEEEAFKMLSACMFCGKCTMVCPRGINTRNLILNICRTYKRKEDSV